MKIKLLESDELQMTRRKVTASKMIRRCLGLCLALFFVMIQLLPVMPVQAAREKQVVRVGCIDTKDFSEKQADGSITGYCVDYLNEIAKYGNFEYEYVFGNWNELRQRLANGEVDVIYTSRNDTANMDYSQEEFVVTLSAIYARSDDDNFYYDDYERLNGSKVGILRNSFHRTYFADYAANKGFTYEECLYDSNDDAMQALLDGEIDAIATDSVADTDGVKCVGTYGTEVMFLATAKGNPLMADINYAINEVTSQEYEFASDLFMKHFDPTGGDTEPNFTREEAAFIKSCPTLKIAFASNILPMAYTDAHTGELAGITPELLDKISEISGLQFEYEELSGQTSSFDYDYFRQKDIDLIAGIEVNKFKEHVAGISLSEPYFTATKVLVGKKGQNISVNEAGTIAIVGGSKTLPYLIAEEFPYYAISTYETLDECLDAVENGKADVLLYNQYLIEQYLGHPQYEDLMIVPNITLEERQAISPVTYGAADPKKDAILSDPMLLSIIDKSIDRISDDEVNEIVIRHTVEQDKTMSVMDFLYKYRYPMIGVLVLLFIIFTIISNNIVQKRKTLKVLEQKNEQLGNAIQIANNASSTKSQFLAQMSHEIRTPMNAVVGMTALARKVPENPKKTNEYLEKIDLSSKMLLSIINDILDMSAIESNKIKIAKESFDIKQLLLSVSTIYYAQCEQKNIAFSMVVEDIIDETLVGDSLRVNQILMNLLSNALKFTDEGGNISVNVSQEKVEEEKIFLQFVVRDDGCGMSEDMLQRLFGAFEQKDATTAKKHGGSGLGMAITKALIDMMHGAIRVESRLGEGTTFVVDIPFSRSHHVHKPDISKLGDMRVLVIDDDRDVLQYTAAVLDEMGVACDMESNGEAALSLIEEREKMGGHYDICMVDWKMPKMSGVEVTRRIRQMLGDGPMVIIVYGYDLSEIEDEARAAGADQFITKPFFQSSVFNALLTARNKKEKLVVSENEEYDFTGHKVLLAEDFELNREVAVDILNEVHLQVECAEDGKEAFEMFCASESGTYDLILMDIQMPNMDGYEATRAIRSSNHPEAKSMPIYAMTANAFTEDVSAALSAGMNGHIAKPIDTQALYQIIAEEISKNELEQ